MESSRCCGNRREIVCVEGFRFGNTTGWAFFQSRYAVESFFSQNALSSDSVANFGTDLRRLLINYSLLPVHISGRNNANRFAAVSEGKRDMQSSAFMGLA